MINNSFTITSWKNEIQTSLIFVSERVHNFISLHTCFRSWLFSPQWLLLPRNRYYINAQPINPPIVRASLSAGYSSNNGYPTCLLMFFLVAVSVYSSLSLSLLCLSRPVVPYHLFHSSPSSFSLCPIHPHPSFVPPSLLPPILLLPQPSLFLSPTTLSFFSLPTFPFISSLLPISPPIFLAFSYQLSFPFPLFSSSHSIPFILSHPFLSSLLLPTLSPISLTFKPFCLPPTSFPFSTLPFLSISSPPPFLLLTHLPPSFAPPPPPSQPSGSTEIAWRRSLRSRIGNWKV